jgi:hypothetical protein
MLGLILTQLNTLAHACPLIETAFPTPASSAMAEPCDGMDMDGEVELTAPCVAHCEFGSHAVRTTVADPIVPPLLDAYLVVDDTRSFDVAVVPRLQQLLTRSTAPPVFASSSRLRI